jgi:post-segregation antitoxin (ccd killing protein)
MRSRPRGLGDANLLQFWRSLRSSLAPRPEPSVLCLAVVYSVCIARVNVYLPDELAEAIRPLGWNLSQVLQSAVRERVETFRLDAWLTELNPPLTGVPGHGLTMAALEPVDGEGAGG